MASTAALTLSEARYAMIQSSSTFRTTAEPLVRSMVSDVTSRTAPLEHDLGMLHAGLAQRNADLESMVEVHAKSVEDVAAAASSSSKLLDELTTLRRTVSKLERRNKSFRNRNIDTELTLQSERRKVEEVRAATDAAKRMLRQFLTRPEMVKTVDSIIEPFTDTMMQQLASSSASTGGGGLDARILQAIEDSNPAGAGGGAGAGAGASNRLRSTPAPMTTPGRSRSPLQGRRSPVAVFRSPRSPSPGDAEALALQRASRVKQHMTTRWERALKPALNTVKDHEVRMERDEGDTEHAWQQTVKHCNTLLSDTEGSMKAPAIGSSTTQQSQRHMSARIDSIRDKLAALERASRRETAAKKAASASSTQAASAFEKLSNHMDRQVRRVQDARDSFARVAAPSVDEY